MVANRKTPAPSNTPGVISGTAFMEDVKEEVEALWRHVQVPLQNVGGTANAITADCAVPIDVNQRGQQYLITPIATNTAAAVNLAIDGKPPRSLKNRDGSNPGVGRLVIGRTEALFDDGTNLLLMNDMPPVTGGALMALFSYQRNAGTDGQIMPSGWSTYPLNTQVVNEIPGLTFDAGTNKLTLPARTYRVHASAWLGEWRGLIHLWNVTDNALFTGQARQSNHYYCPAQLIGRLTLTAPKDLTLRVAANSNTGGGSAVNASAPVVPEQYGFLCLESES